MKKICLFLFQALIALSLVCATGCSKNDDKENDIPSGGLKVGQAYQGGIIAYVDDTGKHGLIAAPADEPGTYAWNDALAVCDELVLKGYDDWLLPSKDELNILYVNKTAIGGFIEAVYWSSSKADYPWTWCQDFSNGNQDSHVTSGTASGIYRVRAIRYF